VRTSVVIIGAGHSGLAMSHYLTAWSIDHVVLERGEVANSWKTERWKSLRLLTPNWQCSLPGHAYQGLAPDDFLTMPDVVAFIESYARIVSAPVRSQTTVRSVRRTDDGYLVETDNGSWRCRAIVVASGACNRAVMPRAAEALPTGLHSITPLTYREPSQLPDGGVLVVGASATGIQLAHEIHRSGRPVTLCVGEHVRLPRTYRGRDIQWWMNASGLLDTRFDEVDDLTRARNLPSPQLVGTPERITLDLNALRACGIVLVGRLVDFRGMKAVFSGSLRNVCALADLKLIRLLKLLDEWALSAGEEFEPGDVPTPTAIDASPHTELDLGGAAIRTVVWATGYRADYTWLDVPVVDHKGRLRHVGGIVDSPGMYLLGDPFMRRRKSSFIHGADDDARELGAHLAAFLGAGDVSSQP
jgi:putative flavoprotein involved in K+ transport